MTQLSRKPRKALACREVGIAEVTGEGSDAVQKTHKGPGPQADEAERPPGSESLGGITSCPCPPTPKRTKTSRPPCLTKSPSQIRRVSCPFHDHIFLEKSKARFKYIDVNHLVLGRIPPQHSHSRGQVKKTLMALSNVLECLSTTMFTSAFCNRFINCSDGLLCLCGEDK